MYNYVRTTITTTCDTREEAEKLCDKAISRGYDAYISLACNGNYIVTQYR